MGRVCYRHRRKNREGRRFLFDDQSWTVQYIVVNLESWLSRRHVLIAVAALGEPDWNKGFSVST